MALNKIFVQISSGDCAGFRSKYVSPAEGVTRDNSYDTKIVFLKDKQEIFTQGEIFGINNEAEVTALSTLIGTLPKRPAVGTEGETGYEAERDYASVIEYIQEMATGQAEVSSKLAADVVVAGGPLADDIADVAWPWGTKDGNKIIPAGTGFEEIFQKLFLAVKNGTIKLGNITWAPSLSKPSASIAATGEQEVGTQTTVTFGTTSTVSINTREVTATAQEGYGYFKNDDSWSSGNCKMSKTGTTTGSVSIESSTWNGTTVASGDTVTIAEGTNTLAVKQSGITASVDALDSDTVYASSNTKSKLSNVSVTVSDTKPSDKALSSENSATITGVRYMFYGASATKDETVDSAVVRALSSSKAETKAYAGNPGTDFGITVPAVSNQVLIAVPSTLKVTEIHDSSALGADIIQAFVESTVDVEGANGYTAASYKLYAYKADAAFGPATYYVKIETA